MIIRDIEKAIEEELPKINASLEQIEIQKTDREITQNLQTQVNNLVLGAVGSGNNAEVIQARGSESVLNERLLNIETGRRLNTPFVKSLKNYAYNNYAHEYITDSNGNYKYVTGHVPRDSNLTGKCIISYTINSSVAINQMNTRVFQRGMTLYISFPGFKVSNNDAGKDITITSIVDLSSLTGDIGLAFQPSPYDKNKTLKIINIAIIPYIEKDLPYIERLIKTYKEEYIPILNLYNNIESDEIKDKSVSQDKLNIPFIKGVENLAYSKTENIGIEITPTLNGISLTSSPIQINNTKKYYIILNITCDDYVDFAIRLRNQFSTVSANPSGVYVSKSNNYFRYNLLSTSALTDNTMTIYISKIQKDYTFTINSLYVIEESQIQNIDKLISTLYYQNSPNGKYVYYHDDNYLNEIPILTIGDSLVNSGGSMASGLRELTGYKNIVDYGIGGDKANTSVGRFGIFPMYVEPFTIPSTATPVSVVLKSSFNSVEMNPATDTMENVFINGIKGDIKNISNDRKTYTFTRKEVGREVVIDRDTTVVTQEMLKYKNGEFFPILCIGTNGGYDTTQNAHASDHNNLIKLTKTFLRKTNGVGLILGFYPPNGYEEYESKMEEEFGNMFFSMRKYFVGYALKDCGLTPTQQDLEYIAQGKVPPQLLADSVHYNSTVKVELNKRIAERLEELGVVKYRLN